MRVSWILFFALTAMLWYLWPRLPLLPGIAHGLGSLFFMACASYFLAKFLWGVARVSLVSGQGNAVLITELWAVVCNAAVMNSGLVEWLTMESITRIFDVNVFGVVRVVKKFLPMLKENHGRAVIVTSSLSHFTLPFTTPYAMTKHAVQSLVDGLRRECHGKGVDIVAVEPLTYRSKVTDAVGCLRDVEKEFKSQPAEVMSGFDAQELHDWTRSMKALYDWRIKDDINDLVDQMALAVRETDPKTRYRTMAIFDYLWVTCLRVLPAEAVDLILLWSRRMALWKK
ncbi:hypothetical protein HPB50_021792 [Hyalomma asiaticum]|uniref:Uncharacterized protein n=1 Tax=Hyalomma asiaticum TaxID=266040 RepID=A0ACB7RSG9_HYAAI|nr:hypothetical protein HPB50_021792 [Hyalomma asiaticum]